MPPSDVDPQVLTIEALGAMAAPDVVSSGGQGLASRHQAHRWSGAALGRGNLGHVVVVISAGSCAVARGAEQVAGMLYRELRERNLTGTVEVRKTGCHGFCEVEPVVKIYPRGLTYQGVSCADVPEIVAESIIRHGTVDRLLYTAPSSGQKCTAEDSMPFYQKQCRLLLGDNSLIDPCQIEDYLAQGGYFGLASALFEMTPEETVDEIGRARLRSRMNGGIPTSHKWQACRNLPSSDGVRRIICSADEGGTGAYMARGLLEGNPHRVIEGMIIGAYAVGAGLGHIHVRDEYSLAARNLSVALQQARACGFLGNDIMGSGFSFDIGVSRGRSAPTCDQSEACFNRFDGRPGNLWLASGNTRMQNLYSCPLVVDDLETWANVPQIVAHGAEWYTGIGTGGSKGTKLFALVGMTRNTGLVEVPMGISLREIIHDIGGGTRTGGKLKAVHLGGPTGSLLPAGLIDTKVDFEELTRAGAGMASSITVLDEHNCVVDLARYFTAFLVRELCGKCSGCQEGLGKMLRLLDDLAEGRGMEDDIALLEGLGKSVRETSLCPQGAKAANPVLSSIKYFADEYQAHAEKHCPAGVCRSLLTFTVDVNRCNGCQSCAGECPQQAITGRMMEPQSIDQHKCNKCKICLDYCEANAILVS